MQEARFAAGLAVALLLCGPAAAGQGGGVVPDLPSQTVATYLQGAGVDRAWAVRQYAFERSPDTRTIEAWSERRKIGTHSCASKSTEVVLEQHNGQLSQVSSHTQEMYAFGPCESSDVNDFREVPASLDFIQLESDYDSVMAAANGSPGTAKITILDKDMAEAFRHLRAGDLMEIAVGRKNRAKLCFATPVRDRLGAIETLSAEVTGGNESEIRVDQCGYIEIMTTKK